MSLFLRNFLNNSKIWRYRHFYIFISPFFILFAIFGLYPLIFSFCLSFAKWDGLTELKWVGLTNLVNVFTDEYFFISLWNTFVIGLLYIPPMFIFAFLLAMILNTSWLKFRGLFRAAVFLPCVTPMVVIAIVFQLLFGQEAGFLNFLIAKFVLFEKVPLSLFLIISRASIPLSGSAFTSTELTL